MDITSLIVSLMAAHPAVATAIVGVVTVSHLINPFVPQVGASSPWLPLRKLLSLLAGNFAHAADQQPTTTEWAANLLVTAATKAVANQQAGAKTRATGGSLNDPTYGDMIHDLISNVDPKDADAYAAGMSKVAEIAAAAVKSVAPASAGAALAIVAPAVESMADGSNPDAPAQPTASTASTGTAPMASAAATVASMLLAILLFGAATIGLSACANIDLTPAERFQIAETTFQASSTLVDAYVQRPDANPGAILLLTAARDAARASIAAAEQAVKTGDPVAMPSAIAGAGAAVADLSAAIAQATATGQ